MKARFLKPWFSRETGEEQVKGETKNRGADGSGKRLSARLETALSDAGPGSSRVKTRQTKKEGFLNLTAHGEGAGKKLRLSPIGSGQGGGLSGLECGRGRGRKGVMK